MVLNCFGIPPLIGGDLDLSPFELTSDHLVTNRMWWKWSWVTFEAEQ